MSEEALFGRMSENEHPEVSCLPQKRPFYLVPHPSLRHHRDCCMKRFGFVGALISALLSCRNITVRAVPSLTSDKPVVYDIQKRASVAEGNAEFLNEDLRVQADKIYYFAESAKALAEGHVRITNGEYRFLAPSGSYCHTEQTVEAAFFKRKNGSLRITCGWITAAYMTETCSDFMFWRDRACFVRKKMLF